MPCMRMKSDISSFESGFNLVYDDSICIVVAKEYLNTQNNQYSNSQGGRENFLASVLGECKRLTMNVMSWKSHYSCALPSTLNVLNFFMRVDESSLRHLKSVLTDF